VLDPVFGYSIIAGVALLFASAAIHKLRSLERFTGIFTAFGVLPEALARRFGGPLIPCLELGIAAALLWEPARRPAAVAAAAVFTVYALALTLNLSRGRLDLDCGCGAPRTRRSIAAWMVWRNLLLAAAVGIAAMPWSPRVLGLTDFLTVAGALMAGVTLYAAVDRLLGDVVPKGVALRGAS